MSIPVMIDEPKRLFSSARFLISGWRNRLGDDIIKPTGHVNHGWNRLNKWGNRVR